MSNAEMQDVSTDFGVQWAIDALNRRKWVALTVFLCTLTAGVSIVRWLPDVYYAWATVLIEHQQIPTQLIRSTVTSSENRLKTIGEEILTRGTLEELINRFDIYPEADDVPMDRLVARLRGEIWVALRRDARNRSAEQAVAFTITFHCDDREKAAAVTNALAALYVEENAKLRGRQAQGISQFLTSQVDEVKKALDEQERKLSRFKEAHLGELPHQQDVNLRTLETLNTQLQQNLTNQAQVNDRRASLQRRLSEGDVGAIGGETVSPSVQLADMKQRLAQLRTVYSDRYPDVVRLKEEIAAIEATISGTAPREAAAIVEDPIVTELKIAVEAEDQRLKVLSAEAEALRARIDSYSQRVENSPRVEQEFQLLSRDYDTTMELYRSLLNRQKEAELAENMEETQKGEQFRVIEPAVPPARPDAPNRSRLWVIALVAAIGLAVGSIVLLEFTDASFHSVDDLRSFTDIRLLGSVPVIDTAADRSRRRWKFALGAVALALGLVAITAGSYIFADGNTALTAMLSF